MKSSNNRGLIIAGLAIAGILLSPKSNSQQVSSIDGNDSRSSVIKNYLWALGLPEGHPQLEARWKKLSTQGIINEAFSRGIIIVNDNPVLRKILVKKYLFELGLPEGHRQLEATWKSMTLQQLVDYAYSRDIRLM